MRLPKDIVEEIEMALQCHCAEDAETGAYLMRSNGRRKTGRPRNYWYHAPGMINSKKITAYSDQEAIDQINGEMERKRPEERTTGEGAK